MTTLSYDEARLQPLLTDLEIEQRVAQLIGRARQRQLWLLFLDDQQVQLPQLVPVDQLPDSLEPQQAYRFAGAIGEAVRAVRAASVILVLEELHDPVVTARDLEWAGMLHSACAAALVRVRGVLLSHRTGVRWLPQDDFRSGTAAGEPGHQPRV